MSVASKALLLLGVALLSASCGRSPQPADNQVVANGPMDVETLPPDESDATPTNQLENGDDAPDVNDSAINGD